jgi:predicted MPP superfamily phosphohydrolase
MGFLLTALGIWTAMHAYVALRTVAQVGWRVRVRVGVVAGAAVLMIAPLGGRLLMRRGAETLGRVLTQAGWLWGGAFFLLFSICVFTDGWNLLLSVVGWTVRAVRRWRLRGPGVVHGQLVLAAVLSVYALLEAQVIGTEHVRLVVEGLPPEGGRVRIVQLSDVHYGPSTGANRLRRIMQCVRVARPDLLVLTGDMLESGRVGEGAALEMLRSVEAPLGRYAVTGNHEYYGGLQQSLGFLRDAGFTVLSNEHALAGDRLCVVGVDDPTALRWAVREAWEEAEILRAAPPGRVVVFLKHQPVVEEGSRGLFELQLSGHAHRGQVFPFTLLVRGAYRYVGGLYELPEGGHVYVTRGAGTWGPPMRLASPPEVTVIDLVPARSTDRVGDQQPQH